MNEYMDRFGEHEVFKDLVFSLDRQQIRLQ